MNLKGKYFSIIFVSLFFVVLGSFLSVDRAEAARCFQDNNISNGTCDTDLVGNCSASGSSECSVGQISSDSVCVVKPIIGGDCFAGVNSSYSECRENSCPVNPTNINNGDECVVTVKNSGTGFWNGIPRIYGVWDDSSSSCIQCDLTNGNLEDKTCGDNLDTNYNGSNCTKIGSGFGKLEQGCSASVVLACDEIVIGESCGGIKICDSSGACVDPVVTVSVNASSSIITTIGSTSVNFEYQINGINQDGIIFNISSTAAGVLSANSCTTIGGFCSVTFSSGVASSYTVTGVANGISGSDNITVIDPPPACNLTATPSSIIIGGSSSLDWSTLNSDNASITAAPLPNIGVVLPTGNTTAFVSGSEVVSPIVDTTYTITAENLSGLTDTCTESITVTALPPEDCTDVTLIDEDGANGANCADVVACPNGTPCEIAGGTCGGGVCIPPCVNGSCNILASPFKYCNGGTWQICGLTQNCTSFVGCVNCTPVSCPVGVCSVGIIADGCPGSGTLNCSGNCAPGDSCVAGVCVTPLPLPPPPPPTIPAVQPCDGSAALVPCGRNCNDLATDWDESEPCTLCHGILMSQLIIEFMIKLAGIAAVIAIAIGGFLYMFAAGNQGAIDTAKSVIKNVLIGFILVFIAWALIDTILTMFGYIDPVGGEWYDMDC